MFVHTTNPFPSPLSSYRLSTVSVALDVRAKLLDHLDDVFRAVKSKYRLVDSDLPDQIEFKQKLLDLRVADFAKFPAWCKADSDLIDQTLERLATLCDVSRTTPKFSDDIPIHVHHDALTVTSAPTSSSTTVADSNMQLCPSSSCVTVTSTPATVTKSASKLA